MFSWQVLLLLLPTFIPAISISCFSLKHHRPSLLSKFHFTRNIALKMKQSSGKKGSKRLILIRHGCTYMNEYLATPGSQWGDANFTDVFHPSEHSLYRDSPLSNKGKMQAQDLHEYFQSTEGGQLMIRDIEMVAVSPLQRTLQTAEIAVLPHLQDDATNDIPIVALPLASERVYLMSDHGKCKKSLSQDFPFADFVQEFERFEEDWWFSVEQTANKKESGRNQEFHSFASIHIDDYIEWRPNDQNQIYSGHGEPDDLFEQRMMELYKWLENRDESVICLVCHWGVLDWLTGKDFKNCEVRDVSFEDVRMRVLRSKDQNI